ncbi:MAG: hypothetical protein KC549_12590, partial [Myxococcales bacterium]|nr:hypothetical protein [Myxococcales bacterium]
MATENPEPAFDEPLEDWDAPPPRRRGYTMRNPVLLVLVLAGSVFMAIKYWPRVAYLIESRNPADCGRISDRPITRMEDEAKLPPLEHDRFCTLTGVVQTFTILATGEARDTPDPRKRNEGRKYYVKLDGDRVFAVIAADRPDVVKHRERQGSLLGFDVEGAGRMIDPDREPGYAATARTLRLKFGVPEGEPMRVFDTTDTPGSRWPAALAFGFLVITASLALLGLIRLVRLRLAGDDEPDGSLEALARELADDPPPAAPAPDA